MKEDNMLISC